MKKIVLVVLGMLTLVSCSETENKNEYSKAIIYSFQNGLELAHQEIPGPFILVEEPSSKFIRIFNKDNTIGVEYFSDQIKDGTLPLLNTQTGKGTAMKWRKDKKHVINYINVPDTLGFGFYDYNAENPIKSTFLFIK